jgi:hypothetical protein
MRLAALCMDFTKEQFFAYPPSIANFAILQSK